MMNSDNKRKVEARLKRVVGQVSGVQRMVEEDRYCVDVLIQLSAARAALAKVSTILLQSHIETCVASAFDSDDAAERSAKIEELVRVFDKECKR